RDMVGPHGVMIGLINGLLRLHHRLRTKQEQYKGARKIHLRCAPAAARCAGNTPGSRDVLLQKILQSTPEAAAPLMSKVRGRIACRPSYRIVLWACRDFSHLQSVFAVRTFTLRSAVPALRRPARHTSQSVRSVRRR